MKSILLLITALLMVSCNCGKSENVVCACYVFDPDCATASTYIEIHQDGFIEAMEGLCTDTIDHIVYDGGELYPNKTLFISTEEFPDSEYDKESNSWSYHSYKRPTIKKGTLSKRQMDDLKSGIHNFMKSKHTGNGESMKINGDNINWESYGVVLLIKDRTFDFWEKSSTKDEKNILKLISKLSPIPIRSKASPRDCLTGDNDPNIVEVQIK